MYVREHNVNPLDGTAQGSESHLQREVFAHTHTHTPLPPSSSPRKRCMALGEEAGWPKTNVPPPACSKLYCLPYSLALCIVPGTLQEMGLQVPAQVVALHLISIFPTPAVVGVSKQAEQGGNQQGQRMVRDSMGPYG